MSASYDDRKSGRFAPPSVSDRSIWDIWLSMHQLPAMEVADEVGLYQALEHSTATVTELAERLDVNARATGVLCSMLTALGLLVPEDGRLLLSEAARTYLLPQSPYYWGPLLRALGVLPQQRAALMRALRARDNGAAMTSANLPSRAWESGHLHREQAESVSRIMHCHSLPASLNAARLGDFGDVRRLLDAGGGSGCFSIAIAQRYEHIHCSIMELPVVCEIARTYVTAGGVSDRVDTVPLDMFRAPWPRGYDGILLSNVFHDWSIEDNLLLARKACEALPSGGRIFIHEMLLAEDGSGPPTTASFSMLMMFGTAGRQYTLSELHQILTRAGFADVSVRQTHDYYSMVSARKP